MVSVGVKSRENELKTLIFSKKLKTKEKMTLPGLAPVTYGTKE